MNPTRLFVLGALARHGPMCGHQIRRDARIDRSEQQGNLTAAGDGPVRAGGGRGKDRCP